MARKKKDKNLYTEQVENYVTEQIKEEYDIAHRNQTQSFDEFERIIDMLECKRTEKDYEWLSDVFIPEYPAIHLTEASQWVNQYFPSRDFVDVYLDGKDEQSVKSSKASKMFINSMLNVKNLYHFHKYVRARSINSTYGCVYTICSWKQKVQTKDVETTKKQHVGNHVDGTPMLLDVPDTQKQTTIIEDRFNYEVPDPRNVFTDNSYCYSMQDKEWIIVRSEMSYEQLKELEEENGYINLDLLKELTVDRETETAKDTKKNAPGEPPKTQLKYFDVLERFGKIWAIIEQKDEEGYPTKISPAKDDRGILKDNAELVESIVTMAITGSKKILIRFQPTPFRTSKNVPFRPIIRGLNYIHPVKDVGMSDGKYERELQIALNDTINQSNDRTKLATMPTLKGKRNSVEDNDSIYFEPEHMMVLEDTKDVEEFAIRDNIEGAMQQANLFMNHMEKVGAIYPTTMGDLPAKTSTTATAVHGAEQRTNLRANYKSLTYEYTYLNEFYWMMMQMGYQFMREETANKILGELAHNFDPSCDYQYQPISSNIEQEYSKMNKIKNLDQMIGRLVGLAKVMPGLIFPVLKMTLMQFELLGQEAQTIVPILNKVLQVGMAPQEGQGQGGNPQTPQGGNIPMSNQNEVPMSGTEVRARENATGEMIG